MDPAARPADFGRLLEGLFQGTTDGVLLAGPDGSIFRANPAACRLLDRTEAEIVRLGRQGLMVDEPGLRGLAEERRKRGATEGIAWFRLPDGTTFPAELRSSLVPDGEGPPATCFIFRDARTRRRAEELGALQQAISLLPVGVVAVEVPPEGPARVVATNQAYQRIVGSQPAPGATVAEVRHRVFLPDRRSEPTPDDWPGARAARSGQVVPAQEFHLRLPDGGWRIIVAVAAPVGAAEPGQPRRAVTVLLDVTEERAAAPAERASAARLRAVVEGAADGFFLHDFQGRFRDVNQRACESLGYTREELLGLGIADVERGFDLAAAQREWAKVEPGQLLTLHGIHHRKDGTTFPAEVRFAMVAHEGERLYTVMIRDMTEQVARESALRASQQALRLLVATNEALLRAQDEQELFREICRVAVEQGGFRMAWAGLPGEGPDREIRPVAWHGHDEGYLSGARLTWSDEERGRGPAGTAMRTGRVAVANDLATDPGFEPWREAAAARGYASNAVLPLVHRGERLGVIGAFSGERGAFTPEVIALLQRVADDLAFGLVSLRQRAASARSAAELALAGRLFGLEVSRLDLATGRLSMSPRARLQRGLPPEGPDLTLDQVQAGLPAEDRAAVRSILEQARRSTPERPFLSPIMLRRLAGDGGADRWIEACSTTLHDAAGRPATVLTASVDVTERVEEREQLRALTARVQRVREEEKARIARDLHDDLGQVLTALQLELRGAEALVEALGSDEQAGPILDRLVAASALAGDTIGAVQRLSWGLRSEALERLGLDAALRQELRLFERRTGLEVAEALRPVAPLPPALATAAFRIAQEALTNVARHAGAQRVEVGLEDAGGDLVLEVADDGRGFPEGAPPGNHLGVLGMRERAREFGGDVTITPRPGGGARVVLRVPRPPGGAT